MKVFVTREILPAGLKLLKAHHDVDVWEDYAPPAYDALLNKVKDCDGIVTMLSDKIDARVIEAAKNLKVISQMAVGYDNIDVAYATSKGIYVTNTPDVLTESSADFSFALLMAIARRIVEADQYVRSGSWKVAWHPTMMLGGELYGATLGIVGAGRIGRAMARRAKGFNMNILYTARSAKLEFEKECGAKHVELDDLLRQSDFVSLHVPLTNETKGLINADKLALMKKTAYLISNARGPVIDETSLYQALKENKIAGAALDVFCKEPALPDNPLFSLKNIVVAPHISSAGVVTREKMSVMVAENIIAALSGNKPKNLLNNI